MLVQNDGDLETTVHWHGLRLDNRDDGTHETQAPIPIGGSFRSHYESGMMFTFDVEPAPV